MAGRQICQAFLALSLVLQLILATVPSATAQAPLGPFVPGVAGHYAGPTVTLRPARFPLNQGSGPAQPSLTHRAEGLRKPLCSMLCFAIRAGILAFSLQHEEAHVRISTNGGSLTMSCHMSHLSSIDIVPHVPSSREHEQPMALILCLSGSRTWIRTLRRARR